MTATESVKRSVTCDSPVQLQATCDVRN